MHLGTVHGEAARLLIPALNVCPHHRWTCQRVVADDTEAPPPCPTARLSQRNLVRWKQLFFKNTWPDTFVQIAEPEEEEDLITVYQSFIVFDPQVHDEYYALRITSK